MKKYLGAGAALVVALILPILARKLAGQSVGTYWITTFTEILIMGLFAVSFNMIFGYMGQLSFGHAAYFGVGAYVTGLLLYYLKVPLPICLVASMVGAGIAGWILGYFCVRLTGIYFAILTMAFGQVIFYIAFKWYDFTHGDNNLELENVKEPIFNFLSNHFNYYYFTLGIVVLALYVMWRITESPFGYTMRAIRDNTERTRFVGINTRKYMLINFVIASMFAGLAGALWGPYVGHVDPRLCNWESSGTPVFMTLIGGAGSFWGPLVGAAIYTELHAVVDNITQYWPLTIGIVIVFVVLFMPGGVAGIVDMWKEGRRPWGSRAEADVSEQGEGP